MQYLLLILKFIGTWKQIQVLKNIIGFDFRQIKPKTVMDPAEP